MSAAAQSIKPQRGCPPRPEASCTAREKPVDEELSSDQTGENCALRRRGIARGSRGKIHSAGRAITARPSSRLLYSKPPLGSLTQVCSPAKAKPPDGATIGPDRGSATAYFGANSVASALNLLRDRDIAENHTHSKPHLPASASKPDISTLRRIGHFYFALTATPAPLTPAGTQDILTPIPR